MQLLKLVQLYYMGCLKNESLRVRKDPVDNVCMSYSLWILLFGYTVNLYYTALLWCYFLHNCKIKHEYNIPITSKSFYSLANLRILAMYEVKNRPPWYILPNNFITKTSFKNLNNFGFVCTRGVCFLHNT